MRGNGENHWTGRSRDTEMAKDRQEFISANHRVTESPYHRVINESPRHPVVSSTAKELAMVLEANSWKR
jgi:hypothetical protein